MSVESSPAVRCAAWARMVGLDPGGTAGSQAGFIVVDWPLPWPRDMSEIAELQGVAAAAGRHGLRVQGRVPTPGRSRRISLYRRPGAGSFTRYDHDEIDIGDGRGDDLAAVVSGVLDGRSPRPRREDHWVGEVLVCTHGRRDACCGTAGTSLYLELTGAAELSAAAELTGAAGPAAGRSGTAELSGPAAGLSGTAELTGTAPATVAGRSVGRTSHTGGHRFAPTALVLPEGTAWAFADADLIRRVVTGSGPLDDIVDRYRGCAGLGSAAIQSLERAVLPQLGWSLLRSARRGEELGGDRVRLSVVDPEGGGSTWEAEVVAGRTMAVPDCGRPLDEARKTETERVVRGLRRVV